MTEPPESHYHHYWKMAEDILEKTHADYASNADSYARAQVYALLAIAAKLEEIREFIEWLPVDVRGEAKRRWQMREG